MVRLELRPVSESHGLVQSPRLGALVVRLAGLWVD